jgi:ABC-type glycerol-3-phosphate transport system substrate-binding protein
MKKILSLCLVLAVAAAVSLGAQTTITLKMGDNLPDRTTTWGAVVEKINAEFKAANPGVEFVTESYQDQPYQ